MASLLAGADWRARHRIARYVAALAPLELPAKQHGSVLQAQVFRTPGLLPVYGSSELSFPEPTRPDHLFPAYRADFEVFLVGQPGEKCLEVLQSLAAAGRDAHGRKVVVFLSPVWFVGPPNPHPHYAQSAFASNFSPAQAAAVAFQSPLSAPLKQAIARRLLDFRKILQREPLVELACTGLADGSWQGRCLLGLLSPCGALLNTTFRLRERWEISDYIVEHRDLQAGHRLEEPEGTLAWSRLAQKMERASRHNGPGTPYSLDVAAAVESSLLEPAPPARFRDNDVAFLRRMAASKEWGDLELLLRVIKELDAQALLVGQPFNGLYSDACGVTAGARQQYYQRIGALAARYGVALNQFSAHELERSFFHDDVHPSATAWIYYDRALDSFYHGAAQLPP